VIQMSDGNAPGAESVTVATMTRSRPTLLRRAIDSLSAQVGDYVAEHLVLVDDCPATWDSLAAALPPIVKPRYFPRMSDENSGPRRLSKLRGEAASLATGEWLAFLDDDDLWTSDHLRSLLETARRENSDAVYCWRQLVDKDGAPARIERFPWKGNPAEAKSEFERMVNLGVLDPDLSVFRDSATVHGADGSIVPGIVDGGAWLIRTQLAREVGFHVEFSPEDGETLEAEDTKFLKKVLNAGVRTACSRRATLVYHLGGYSNVFDANGRPVNAGEESVEAIDWT